jgi:hypothetical protein
MLVLFSIINIGLYDTAHFTNQNIENSNIQHIDLSNVEAWLITDLLYINNKYTKAFIYISLQNNNFFNWLLFNYLPPDLFNIKS